MFDGARIGRSHRSGSSAAACLNQEPRKPLRNHAAANMRQLREKQEKVGETGGLVGVEGSCWGRRDLLG